LCAQVLLLGALLGIPEARAGRLGEVVALAEQVRPGGAWQRMDMVAGSVCIRDGMASPIAPGFALQEGDRLVSGQGRVAVALDTGERLLVRQGSDIRLGQRLLVLLEGGVYLDVDAPFSVSAQDVLVAVEGTRFLVEGPDPVLVALQRGALRITAQDEPALLAPGELAETFTNNPPDRVQSIGIKRVRGLWESSWLRGEAPLALGLLAGGGLLPGGVGLQGRLYADLALVSRLHLLADLGAGSNFDGLLLPAGLGLAWDLGSLSAGAQALAVFDAHSKDCGQPYRALHIGAVAALRADLLLSRSTALVAALRGGYAGGPLAELSLGVGWGL